MTLPYNFSNYINIALILVYAFYIIRGYRKGLLAQLLSIVGMLAALILAWLLAPQLAHAVPLIPSNLDLFSAPFIGESLFQISNSVVWYVIVFVVVNIIMTFVVKPAAKTIHAIPIANLLNHIAGALFGIIVPTILALVATFVLSSPLFVNGRSVVEASLLNPLTNISDIVLESIYRQSDEGSLVQKVIKGESINSDDFISIPEWFAQIGLPDELKEPFEKLINQEALSSDEINQVTSYIGDQGWTMDDLKAFLDSIGLSATQVEEIANKLS